MSAPITIALCAQTAALRRSESTLAGRSDAGTALEDLMTIREGTPASREDENGCSIPGTRRPMAPRGAGSRRAAVGLAFGTLSVVAPRARSWTAGAVPEKGWRRPGIGEIQLPQEHDARAERARLEGDPPIAERTLIFRSVGPDGVPSGVTDTIQRGERTAVDRTTLPGPHTLDRTSSAIYPVPRPIPCSTTPGTLLSRMVRCSQNMT